MAQKSRLQAQTACYGKCEMKPEKQRLSASGNLVQTDWPIKTPVTYNGSNGKGESRIIIRKNALLQLNL